MIREGLFEKVEDKKMSGLGVNRDYLKKRNRGLVLKLVATERCTSRAELARVTGLTKTAISSIVNELIEKEYLKEAEKETTGEIGRSPIKLEIGSKSPKYAGCLIGRNLVEVALCDMNLKLFKYERVEQKWKDKRELMDAVCRLLDHILENQNDVIGIGVSAPGPVNVKEGKIVNPGYFEGIENVYIVEPLQKRYNIPVFFDHDVQSDVVVEQLYGNGKDYQDVLMIGIGRGVGCGIMLGGKRYQSNSGYHPEIGHMSISHHGNRCICGNIGCLETYVNSEVILKKAQEILGRKISYRVFCQMEDNKEIQRIMTDMVTDISCAVISLMNILNFEIILLGMDSVYWPEKYVDMMEDMINARKYSNRETRVRVKKVSFLDKTSVLGAVSNALIKTFEGDLL